MSYEKKESKLFKTFEEAGIHNVNYNRNQQKLKCPKCFDTRENNKSDTPLYLSPRKGLWKCFHCDWTGGLFGSEHKPIEKRVYTLPIEKKLGLDAKVTEYFHSRGIEDRVLEYFKIGLSFEENKRWINFPYYRNKQLINVKRRDAKKDFRLSSNAELIFYNLDSIFDRDEIIITEGEIDCMTVYQCGFFGVVSVPNGAQKGNARMEYLDNCFEYFEDAKKVILCVDNDEAGAALSEELSRRIGREKCWTVEYNEGCKDINEVLKLYGEAGVKNVIRTAKQHPVVGINKPMEYRDEVINYHLNGFPSGDKLGYDQFDKIMSFRQAELTVVVGIPNSGKSAWVDQALIRLSSRHGWRHGILSREQWPHSIHLTKLVQVFSNKGLRTKEMNVNIIDKSMKFLDEHLFLFGIDDLTIDGILEKAKQLVLRYGIKSLIIDPWNTLDHDLKGFPSETEYIRNALKKVILFKDMYSVHVILVVHPTKVQTNSAGAFIVPDLYSIAGSAHWFNMIDNGIVVYRNLGTRVNKVAPLGDTVTVFVKKVRNFFVGEQGSTTFNYNFMTGNYAEEDGAPFECEYDNWLFKNKEIASIPIPIPFPTETPQLTDISKLIPVPSSFDVEPISTPKEPEELVPDPDGETPF